MKKGLAVLIFAVLILPLAIISASAVESDFATEPLSQEQEENARSFWKFRLLTQAPMKSEVESFDVNEEHKLAVVFRHMNTDYVAVYQNGDFLYGYCIDDVRGQVAVEWVGDNINIATYDRIITVTPDAEVVEVAAVLDTRENRRYLDYLCSGEGRVVDDITYTARSAIESLDWAAAYYVKIVATDADGNETILYDVSSDHVIKVIFWVLVAAIFCAIIIISLVRGWKNAKNEFQKGATT